MTEIVQANRIMHGKEDLDRQTIEELTGPRRDEYAAAMKDAGVSHQAVWHQQMPGGGTLSILYIEATDPDAHQRFLSSDSDVSRFGGNGRRKFGDVMSRCRLFRSSWFTTSASNGRACPAVGQRTEPPHPAQGESPLWTRSSPSNSLLLCMESGTLGQVLRHRP
jgi:hypothetical protein